MSVVKNTVDFLKLQYVQNFSNFFIKEFAVLGDRFVRKCPGKWQCFTTILQGMLYFGSVLIEVEFPSQDCSSQSH